MKRLCLLLIAAALPVSAQNVNGYYRKDGTYVAPHMRTAPDNNPYNNYSTQGNTNPYTGQRGNVAPQPQYSPPPMYSPPPSYPQYTPPNPYAQPRARQGNGLP
jgi:hypothetical protein